MKLGPMSLAQGSPRHTLSPREVLDLHADLQRLFSQPTLHLTASMKDYAWRDVGEKHREWGRSHIHPSTSLDDLDPWLASLGDDLTGATTYQVTAEMLDLAEAMRDGNADIADIRLEDLPADEGFMWFDRPVIRPSVEDDEDHPSLFMHAVSWALVPSMEIVLMVDDQGYFRSEVPAVRIREWGYYDAPDVFPRPLHLMGQATVPLTEHIHTPLSELWTVHMLWILMGMKITATETALPDRHTARRARNLEHQAIQVIRLRRTERKGGKPSATPKVIDWSCTWLVRGHYRAAPHGGTFKDGRDKTWVAPYIKGPDGLPLKVTDIIYKLAQ